MDLPETPSTENSLTPEVVGNKNNSNHQSEKSDIEQNKDLAAFSYLWIMSVIVYFLKRQSPFIRFHAKQAMVIFALSIVLWFVPIINGILELGVLCLMVMGFVNAAQGKQKDVPIIGPLSRREIGLRDAWKQLIDAIVRIVHLFTGKKNGNTPPPSPPPSLPSP